MTTQTFNELLNRLADFGLAHVLYARVIDAEKQLGCYIGVISRDGVLVFNFHYPEPFEKTTATVPSLAELVEMGTK